jgi:hypothetical protein
MELLIAYGVSIDSELGQSLITLARDVRNSGWWQRLDALSTKYATYIAYEVEARELHHFESTLIRDLLQTESYAREVISVGREPDEDTINQLVRARLTRQEVLTRKPPLRTHMILSEAALRMEVGSPAIARQQLEHIVGLSRLSNVTIQVLRFAAGAHLATRGGFAVLTFNNEDPPLGYIETLAGELFLESAKDIARLTSVYDHLRTLAMSPAESIKLIKEYTNGT